MASHTEHDDRNGLIVDENELYEGKATKKDCEERDESTQSPKGLHHSASSAESNASSVASFTTNHNSVVCLPLVSEGLKLVWTQSDQTRELDTIPELVHAFNLFPYPSSREVNTLARMCALPLDKVKVWFMVQRIKYGISWSSEEIEETRRKLAVPELYDGSMETNEEVKSKSKSKHLEELVIEDKDSDEEECAFSSFTPQIKKSKCESPDSYKATKSTVPCFSSTLPPPQDSYFYHPPADTTANATADVSLDLSDSSSGHHRHGRYKKSKAQLAALRKSFLRENWPAEAELRRLQEETGLSRNDIRKWFSDSRYQLRVGRGSLAAAQNSSPQTAVEGKQDPQSQPLPLVNQKSRQINGTKGHEGTRNNGIRNSHFFQTFLSNSLEAFGERVLETQGQDVIEELSGDEGSFQDEEQSEEQPLQLTKTCRTEPDVSQELKSSPYSSPSGSPPPTASPNKPLSHRFRTSKKSVHSTRTSPSQTPMSFSGASTSTSPALTPAGRPRKTKEQLDVLKQHFLRCQWPKSEEYTELVKLTGLPRADVIQWFGDTRYAVKNGQLRWVKGVRDQFLAELAIQQSSSGFTNGSGTSTRGGRKRKSQTNGTNTDTPDIQPLVTYYLSTGALQEKDLDSLCKKSRMSYQQVRDWFASQDVGEPDQEPVVD
ncbi:homeobox and leucine zipper encoding a [Melanotaenia boesemani]|uniref:homeobox and leucine zipper encoding a n=1 Tax=Melanotaenia boesemani TaxID=1250792 RepID=UPI001C054552|nr:homeobox and leucine zipper encoding a [Melanotaenia boesemani]XP_041848010.1 homeobox and leucine zipper encoding a [Melanotaenia boesemani]XP_041848011.1 homeobox and leucine zipper encoding a [Melanotaenia boesemani]XP_041848012.1 homeobox and leucine zipper encoding a [Melanotaenia boesemani]XP_041848013.1 homeobox and leucine zipper encoding a [Melanotaenia boesemani]